MGSRNINIWKSVDWVTVVLYALLVFAGWISIYAASYDFDHASIFDYAERSGKQLLWIGLAFVMAFMILMVEARVYETYAYLIYVILVVLLAATIFLAPDIKGSHSWLKLGPVSLQPAEFAKFATSLALARLFSTYNFVLTKPANFIRAVIIIVLPILLIMMQKETGSALVYTALVFVLYREGMSGMVLFGGFCAVLYFVVGLKYSDVMWGASSLGETIVLIFILLVMAGMVLVSCRNLYVFRNLFIGYAIIAIGCYVTTLFGVPVHGVYVGLAVVLLTSLYLLLLYLQSRISKWLVIISFALASVIFLFSVNYVFNDILEYHQRMRIEVALGMKEDLRGAGYNVNQSKIAIGSGGVWGKGFLNGTQTKLKYVPEQDTDFIFCTIGEEEGFWGSAIVLILFAALIFRVIVLSERQRTSFGRVYAYCVASILFFHVGINVGMVIGLCPVIGIPLPFFSYGGSSLWGFTILLFVLLSIDARRSDHY